MPVTPVPKIPGALATPATFVRRFPVLAKTTTEITIAELLVEATAHLEDRTSRRLAPFTNILYEDRLEGIDPDEYGGSMVGVPLSYAGSLGVSYANAIGAEDLMRHFWLAEYAPFYPTLWTYDLTSIEIYTTYSSNQTIYPGGSMIIGDSPSTTDGHVWIALGTFTPPGTRIKVVYSGGYTVGIPPALSRACLFQAAKFSMLEAAPQTRKEMNMDEIDSQIDMLIAPWVRG